ncbi:uncharacterized protein LOC143920333 [Arctopsyche grandis]|uniref:uncharacterized protein LOC143920333 n=1 Tax=Arctopsyche grandis TaxID=121162 RepID=UPI00406D9A12
MFQSDDFDDIFLDEALSTIDETEFSNHIVVENSSECSPSKTCSKIKSSISPIERYSNNPKKRRVPDDDIIINDNSYNSDMNDSFNTSKRNKRKFPGPAGLLPDDSKINVYESKCTMSLSQCFSNSQNQLPLSIFGEGPWCLMQSECIVNKNSLEKYNIANIKTQAKYQILIDHRVPIMCGVIQNIDCSLQHPSIVIRDPSGSIQGTLHHDVWKIYNSYLVPQHSAILLKNTTVLTTGSKKNYLNITLNNIVTIYCDSESSYIQDKNKQPLQNNQCITKLSDIDIVDWKTDKIIVIRKSSIESGDSSLDEKRAKNSICKGNSRILDESIVETLLEGIDYNILCDEFD